MSEPKRYHHFIKFYSKSFTDVTGARYCYPDAGMIEDKDGKYVEYEDYARLKAEVERLRIAGSESEPRFVLLSDYQHLRTRVERLTKAGDNLVYVASEHPVSEPFVKAWFAAKEGKQS